jgi:predicted enzyme involved in methoxymalonyl-ACP biosynthesis
MIFSGCRPWLNESNLWLRTEPSGVVDLSVTERRLFMAEFKSPAEESATNILEGVQILQKYNSKATLVALDKSVFCDGPAPEDDEEDEEDEEELDDDESSEGKKMTADVVEQLEDLGWEWDEEQSAWGYYTGHG